MSVNLYNHERYLDPTAYEALRTIERETKRMGKGRPGYPRKMVFVCSPFKGDVRSNIRNARRFSKFVVQQNFIPIAPHLLFPQFLDDNDRQQRVLGIRMGLVLLSKCRELWCFGNRMSQGMAKELDTARQRNIRVRYFTDDCEEV